VIEKLGAALPFTCEQVFDLAADIERYPEFLPWWVSAQIRRRDANICYVEQVMGLGPIRLRFESKAVMYRPRRIEITSADAQFRMCDFSWVIAATSFRGCRISIAAEIELRSVALQTIVNHILPASIDEIVRAFDARAHTLYTARRG
jgi:coenzyme Q-binding protein COQ10